MKGKIKELDQDELLELCTTLKRFAPNFFAKVATILKMPYPTAKHQKVAMLKKVMDMVRKEENESTTN